MSPYGPVLSQKACITTSLVIVGFFFFFGIIFRSDSPYLTLLVIPGGGQTPSGDIPAHTQLRLDRAVEIYRLTGTNNFIFCTLSGGTPHKPNPVDKAGFPIFEAAAASKRLIEMGILPDIIWEENFSLDTIGNAYFMFWDYLQRIRSLLRVVGAVLTYILNPSLVLWRRMYFNQELPKKRLHMLHL